MLRIFWRMGALVWWTKLPIIMLTCVVELDLFVHKLNFILWYYLLYLRMWYILRYLCMIFFTMVMWSDFFWLLCGMLQYFCFIWRTKLSTIHGQNKSRPCWEIGASDLNTDFWEKLSGTKVIWYHFFCGPYTHTTPRRPSPTHQHGRPTLYNRTQLFIHWNLV